MAKVLVAIPGDVSYPIEIEPDLLARIGARVREQFPIANRVGVITDTSVRQHYLEPLERSLRKSGIEPIGVVIGTGEDAKNIASVSRIYDAMLPAKIDRNTPLLALGGGVVGDVAGFAAATILRGVPLIQIPTTLLAMVDASVGGKTGVNHSVGKNLIGAFHQPAAVLIDPNVLKTLPPRELRGGLAECIKHEIIRDADGFTNLEKNIDSALSLNTEYLSQLIAHNVSIKARVVEADPFERGERAHLNFGHTFGHAIETVSNYSYSHGESVALGMSAASFAAKKLGMFDSESHARIINLIKSANLPTGGINLDARKIVAAMAFDKKSKAGKIRFILPDRIGHVVMRDDVPEEVILAAINSLEGSP